MAKKMKLTAEQVKMLQQHRDKKFRISEEQYKRLKEFIDSELSNLSEEVNYKPTPKFLKPAEKLKRDFKKYGKDVKGFKAESDDKLLGHPVGGTGGDEYKPQTPEENEKTFMNEDGGGLFLVDLIEFAQHLLAELKTILTDPSQAGLSTFWVKLGVSRGELFSLLAEFGIIAYVGHKLVVVTKNLAKKIKRLYHHLADKESETQSKNEGMISLGDDMEVINDDNHSVNIDESKLLENKISVNFTKLKDKNGKIRKLKKSDGEYRASTSENKCGVCRYFQENSCKIIRGLIDKEMVCNYFDKKPDTNETTVAGASADGGSSGPYVTPKVWAKDNKNWANANKTMYPSSQIVQNLSKNENFSIKFTHEQYKLIKENFDKTAWPDGEFVVFDDCVKFNNNKEAQKGGCSTGAVDGVVKTSKTKNSIISKEALYYELAKKTGRTIEEVKNIIENQK